MNVGLVLGGGGARGLAHIGALRAIDEHGIKPIAISACSMGAIIGATYAAGYSPREIYEIVDRISYSQVLSFGEKGGLLGSKGLAKILSKHLPKTFEDLNIPLEVTTVDVQTGSLLVLRSGDLITALTATSALPGILSPVRYKGRYLVDGGLINGLPVDIIRTMTLAPVIAVDVAAPPNRELSFEPQKPSMLENFSKMVKERKLPFEKLFRRGLTIELFMKSYDIPQKIITDMRLSLHPPELLIRPKLDNQFGVEDFNRLEQAFVLGYQETSDSLDNWNYKK